MERVNQEKQRIIDFLTGAENAGKAWFSSFGVNPNGEENHDVLIKRIDDAKEGGDWETDIQEAINVICFTMRVHSNLVGSVPGKSQSNNSGSDRPCRSPTMICFSILINSSSASTTGIRHFLRAPSSN